MLRQCFAVSFSVAKKTTSAVKRDCPVPRGSCVFFIALLGKIKELNFESIQEDVGNPGRLLACLLACSFRPPVASSSSSSSAGGAIGEARNNCSQQRRQRQQQQQQPRFQRTAASMAGRDEMPTAGLRIKIAMQFRRRRVVSAALLAS